MKSGSSHRCHSEGAKNAQAEHISWRCSPRDLGPGKTLQMFQSDDRWLGAQDRNKLCEGRKEGKKKIKKNVVLKNQVREKGYTLVQRLNAQVPLKQTLTSPAKLCFHLAQVCKLLLAKSYIEGHAAEWFTTTLHLCHTFINSLTQPLSLLTLAW